MALVLRSTKGSALTHAEMDANFSGLADGSLISFASALALASGQITFPAVQNASSDPNTFDDYEEGTWTMGYSFGGGTTGMTFSLQAASYTKSGNRAHISGAATLSAKGSSTGNALVTGLPFTVRNNSDSFSPMGLRFTSVTFTGQYAGAVNIGTTSIPLQQTTEAGTLSALTEGNFGNTSQVMVGGMYQVA